VEATARLARWRDEEPVPLAENIQSLADALATVVLPTLGPSEKDVALLTIGGSKSVEPIRVVSAGGKKRRLPFLTIDGEREDTRDGAGSRAPVGPFAPQQFSCSRLAVA
jgi:hypothetical protein